MHRYWLLPFARIGLQVAEDVDAHGEFLIRDVDAHGEFLIREARLSARKTVHSDPVGHVLVEARVSAATARVGLETIT